MFGIQESVPIIVTECNLEINRIFPEIEQEYRTYLQRIAVNRYDSIKTFKTYIIPATSQYEGTLVKVEFGDLNVMYFSLHWYPNCCAMVGCNGFYYQGAPKALVFKVMDTILNNIRAIYYENLKRVVFNFVEAPRDDEQFGDIPLIEGTNLARMRYPHLYEWATSKRHQQLLTVNHNTRNIIHFVDCMYTLEK